MKSWIVYERRFLFIIDIFKWCMSLSNDLFKKLIQGLFYYNVAISKRQMSNQLAFSSSLCMLISRNLFSDLFLSITWKYFCNCHISNLIFSKLVRSNMLQIVSLSLICIFPVSKLIMICISDLLNTNNYDKKK